MVTVTELKNDIEEIMPGVVADRRHLHENPELAFEEYETSKFVAERLKQLGLEDIQVGVGGSTGVTGLIRGGKGEGKVALVRADMDALPILEETDVPFKSKNNGVMHACGHDAHTALLLGVARVLMDRKDEFAGTVKVLFQPAEELPPGGAIGMVEAGVLENPHVDAVFGLHVAPDTPAGKIGVRPAGPGSAAADRFRITIQGKGGHAARPQSAVDPVLVGTHIVQAFQTLISRETDPMEAAVLSTTALVAGGEAFNVIPDTAELKGTVRTLSEEVRQHLATRIKEVAEGIGDVMRAGVNVEYSYGYPSIINDAEISALVAEAAAEVVGEENVVESKLGMGGEDFAYFTLERPGCFFRMGIRNEDRGIVWGAHHPRFNIEEEGFNAGLGTMTNAVLKFVQS